MEVWRAPQSPSCGDLDATSSLHPTKILEQHNRSLEEKSRQALRSPSPLDPGGAQALQSDSSQPASSWQFLDALEESLAEGQELLGTSHTTQLRSEVLGLQRTVGHLVLLLDSFHKDEPNSLQLRSECTHLSSERVWDRACRDKLSKEKGAKQEDPNIACSTACKQKGEHNRVNFPENKQQQQQQQQLEEQQKQEQHQEGQLRPADLSSKQKLEQRGETMRRGTKACITRSAAYPSQPQGEPGSFPRRGGANSSTLNKKLGKKQARSSDNLQQLVNNSCNQWPTTTA